MTIYDVHIPDLVPEGSCGVAEVQHYEVNQFASSMSIFSGEPVSPGRYAKLKVGRVLMMSDTSMEKRSNCEFAYQARGRVLVAGLGLGLILFAIADKPEVQHVTVVEKFDDVIQLVGPSVQAKFGDKLDIVCADIFDWKPIKGRTWNVIYFDIWENICTDNLKEIATLHRKFSRSLDRDHGPGWMNSWMRNELQRRKRREDREERAYRW